MKIEIAYDEATEVVTLEFHCGTGGDHTEAERVMAVLIEQVEGGHIDLHLSSVSGEPISMGTMQ